MPTTEFNLTEYLTNLITSLREENAALTELLLQAGHLIPKEEVSVVTIPSKPIGLGKMSWYQRKARLEQLHKPKISELTGIPENEFDEQYLQSYNEKHPTDLKAAVVVAAEEIKENAS
jgi:hypothetical protein